MCCYGIDISEELIGIAKERHAAIGNISFHTGDIYNYPSAGKFQLTTSARVLQWLDHPKEALAKMKMLLTNDGCISILDYNHEKIEWAPHIPSPCIIFTAHFRMEKRCRIRQCNCRSSSQMFLEIGLKNIVVENQFEKTQKIR